MAEGTELLILDGRHLLWRAASVFHDLSADADDGKKRETGGIYGFLRISLASWTQFGGMTLVAWDTPSGPTHRRALYPQYKMKRHLSDSDGDLIKIMRVQEEHLKGTLLPLFGIRQAQSEGWEADDVIATLCARFTDTRISILSGDRDLLQLVTDRISLARPQPKGKFKVETPETVAEEWGVTPAQIHDLKTLAGDPGDNIPGAQGIGPKTAAKLIKEHGSWGGALNWALANEPAKKWHKSLIENADVVRMSAKLVELNRSAPLTMLPVKQDGKRAFIELAKLKFQSLMADGRRQQLMSMGG